MKCIIKDCNLDADNYLGIRLRYPPNGNAVWTPETKAHLCNRHAFSGLDIQIKLKPNQGGVINTEVSNGNFKTVKKTHVINTSKILKKLSRCSIQGDL